MSLLNKDYKLKPCPFCGEGFTLEEGLHAFEYDDNPAEDVGEYEDWHFEYAIICISCGIISRGFLIENDPQATIFDAVTFWNNRANVRKDLGE